MQYVALAKTSTICGRLLDFTLVNYPITNMSAADLTLRGDFKVLPGCFLNESNTFLFLFQTSFPYISENRNILLM